MMDMSCVNRAEALRYMGCKGEPDESLKNLLEECLSQLGEVCEPRHLTASFPLKLGANDTIDAQCFQTESRALAHNLADCDEILLFAATLGTGVDHLIRRYSRLEMSRAVALQAASAAAIEAYCNGVCKELRADYEAKGRYLRPRFSPGYGDFPLSCQPAILGALEAGKRIGIKLTDSFLMMPSKSVSAVMGISKKPRHCSVEGCEVCTKKDCLYRR